MHITLSVRFPDRAVDPYCQSVVIPISMATPKVRTDEEWIAAVAANTTYAGIKRVLGLADGSLQYIKKQIARLELDTSHFDRHPKLKLGTDDELRAIVAASRTSTEVLTKLGFEHQADHFRKLKRRIAELGLDTSHFIGKGGRSKRGTRWTNDDLKRAVENSRSFAGTIRLLGLVPAGGNYDQVQRRVHQLGLDTSHFTGQGWNTGMAVRPAPVLPLEEVLVAGRWTSSHALKKRLFNAGLKHLKCELCGWCERAPDGRIPVELDHANGDRTDNRLVNLRILCPNCHSLQPTHRGLNKRTVRERGRPTHASDRTTIMWMGASSA